MTKKRNFWAGTLDLFDEAEGKRRRDEGMGRAWGNETDGFKEVFPRILREFAASGRIFAADDVRRECERRGVYPRNAKSMGWPIREAKEQGVIAKADSLPIRRVTNHRRPVDYYRGANRDGVEVELKI